MKRIFKPEKRDEAIERLAFEIVKASENCVTVIKKINSISQNPEKYSNPSEMIFEWHKYLFTNEFHDLVDEWISPKIINPEKLDYLQTLFFNYIISIVPFYFEDKIIISPDLKHNKHKWNNDDYLILKKKIFTHRYRESINITRLNDPEKFEKMDKDSINSLLIMTNSRNARKSLWKKNKKIENIFSTDNLIMRVNQICPKYEHFHQEDIFLKYTKQFIETLPSSFDNFNSNFYEKGTYLQKYFDWCT